MLQLSSRGGVISDALANLNRTQHASVLAELKRMLEKKGVHLEDDADIVELAETKLSVREATAPFRDILSFAPVETAETMQLRAFYLRQRVDKVEQMRPGYSVRFLEALLEQMIESDRIAKDERAELDRMARRDRDKYIERLTFLVANRTKHLEREHVLYSIVFPEETASSIAHEIKDLDRIRRMTNAEAEAFLSRAIEVESSLDPQDVDAALEVLVSTFVSSREFYRNAAVRYFSLADVYEVLCRRICLADRQGKIGGKSAGLFLAYHMLRKQDHEYSSGVSVPESYFLTSDVYEVCHALHQSRYREYVTRFFQGDTFRVDLEEEYPSICDLIAETELPLEVLVKLRMLLLKIGHNPIILRSSSLLEDGENAFSGKYRSFFYANQPKSQDPDEDLHARLGDVVNLILQVYASTFSPEALDYRRNRGVTSSDERMCVLVQTVEGKRHGDYHFPVLAGVGFSCNNRVHNESIHWDDPMVRIGVGLGTGVVDIRGNQAKIVYTRTPEYSLFQDVRQVIKASQNTVDVLDVNRDELATLSKSDLSTALEGRTDEDTRELLTLLSRFFLSERADDYLKPIIGAVAKLDPVKHVFTLDGLRGSGFYERLTWLLDTLREEYLPADVEFVLRFVRETSERGVSSYTPNICLVQCRPLTGLRRFSKREVPEDIADANVLFRLRRGLTFGWVPNVRYVVYVDPDRYLKLDPQRMYDVARLVGRINAALRNERYLLIGPGRWGSNAPQYGVPVRFSEINHTLALVEVAQLMEGDTYSATSDGAHFGNDVREGGILSLSVYPDLEGTVFNRSLLTSAPDQLGSKVPGVSADDPAASTVRVVDIAVLHGDPSAVPGIKLHVVTNAEQQQGAAYVAETDTTQEQKAVDSLAAIRRHSIARFSDGEI